LAKENSCLVQDDGAIQSDGSLKETVATVKKPFIEPEISTPVDVLEATTFFQAATSGVSN
jgi:hypothetical protein